MLVLIAKLVTIVAALVVMWFLLRRRPFNPDRVTAVVALMMVVAILLALLGTGHIGNPIDVVVAFGALIVALVGMYVALRAVAMFYGKEKRD